MILLVLGVLLWSAVHFVPTLLQPLRQRLIEQLGDGRYRLGFTVIVLVSIVLMVMGWRATPEDPLYHLPAWTRTIGFVLMWASLFLFAAARSETAIKRFVRHPQLMAIVIWSLSHLLTNGTTRALVLFGGLALWALIEMPLLNARDGVPAATKGSGMGGELKLVAIASVVFVILMFLHPYIAGVPLMRA